jgi:hypothetical protein
LAKAYDVGKFPVADPAAVLDGDAARPDDPAATSDTAERDGEECVEQCGEANGLLQLLLVRHLGH